MSRFVSVAVGLIALLSPAFSFELVHQRNLVFRAADGQATHFSISCGPSDTKKASNLWLILTAIDRRPPRRNSIVTVTTGAVQTMLQINNRGFWSSAESADDISILLTRLRAANTMTLQFSGGATATFDLAGAWLKGFGTCIAPDNPELTAMSVVP